MPHRHADETLAKDRAIISWINQDPSGFHRAVLAHLETDDRSKCWLWPRTKKHSGYGVANIRKKYLPEGVGSQFVVHRAVYLHLIGEIPYGMVLDHDERGCPKHCVNPWHMVVKTHRSNVLENNNGPFANRARQSKCWRGHDLTDPANIRWTGGTRHCITCDRIRAREQQRKRTTV